MLKKPTRIVICFAMLVISVQTWAATLFVQATQVAMRSESKATSPLVVELKRGDRVEGGQENGFWTRVSVKGKSGWVTSLSLGAKLPVGQNTLIDAGKLSDAVASRARVKSETLAAAARNLDDAESLRARGNQKEYRPNTTAVARMETYVVLESALNKFITDANLNP